MRFRPPFCVWSDLRSGWSIGPRATLHSRAARAASDTEASGPTRDETADMLAAHRATVVRSAPTMLRRDRQLPYCDWASVPGPAGSTPCPSLFARSCSPCPAGNRSRDPFTCNCSTHHRYCHPGLDPRCRCSSMTAGKKRAPGSSPGDDREMDVGFIALARHLRMESGHIVRGCRPNRAPQTRSYRNDCPCSTRYGSTTAIMAVGRRSIDRCAAQQKRRRLSPAPPLPIAVEATVCRQLRAAGSKRRVLRRCSRSRRHGLPSRHT